MTAGPSEALPLLRYNAKHMGAPKPKSSILFLCTGNSARSLMAEAIANHQFGRNLTAVSAGSQPKGQPDPLAIQTLQRNKIPTEGLASKSWDTFKGRKFDLVITLCESAARDKTCPVFPGNPPKVHWNLPDPPNAPNPQDMFEAVHDVLMEAIGLLVRAPDETLSGRAAEASRQIARRFSPRAI